MAEDVVITVSAEIQKILDDFKNLEKNIKSVQSSLNNQTQPAVDTTAGKITQMGNKVKGAGEKIKSAIGTETALAFTAAGAAATSFAKQCIDSAIKSESAWNRFGSLVQNSGGQWDGQEKAVKGMVKSHSQQYGFLVSDTRDAGQALMQFGVQYKDLGTALDGVAGVAARTGMTQAEASNMVISALNGRAMQLKKMTGLDIENYRNQDGTIDQMRLLTDLYEQNKGALDKYGNSTEAQINRMTNSWNSFKTSIGQALMPVVKVIADVIGGIADWFSKLDGTSQTIIATLLALGAAVGVVIGALGLIAPVLINVGQLISALGKLKTISNLGKLESWNNFKNKVSSATQAVRNFGIQQKLSNAGGKISGAVSGAWSSLTGKVRSATNAIRAYGIQSKIASAGSAIKGAAMSAWSGITSAINRARTAITAFSIRQLASSAAMKVHAAATAVWNGATKAAAIAQGVLNAVMAMNPIYLVVAAIVALIAVLGYLYFNNEQVRNTINALGDYLKGVFIPIWNALVGTLTAVWDWFMQIWNGSKSLGEAFGDIGALIGSVFGGIYGWIAGALSGVGGAANDALQGLWDAFRGQLGGLGQWLWKTLNDLPRIITDALSNLGNMVIPGGGLVAGIMAIFAPLPTLIFGVFNRLFPTVLPSLMSFVNGIVSWFASIGGRIAQTIMNLPQIVAMYFMLFIQSLQMRLNQARAVAGMLASMIRQAIVTRMNTIVMRVRMIFMRVVQAIRTRLNQARAIAGMLAGMIRQVIVTRLNALVARVRALFTRVVSAVRNRLANAVSAAREKAQEIVTNIATKVAEVPQKVADEFNKVADRVRSALANAAAAAASGARDIVNRFLSGLGVASPGIAQRTAAWEFNSIVGIIQDSGVRAVKATKDMATGISSMWLRNKPELGTIGVGMSMEDFQNIPRLPLPVGVGMDVLGQNIARPDLAVPQTGMPRVTNNTQNTTDDHTVHYHIDRITLECSELTQEQSRRVLYNALDGLYGRGT